MAVSPHLRHRIHAIQADRSSGASGIAGACVDVLTAARDEGSLLEAARLLVRAQPSMAPVWNAAIQALGADPDRFDRYREQIRRAPRGLARFAAAAFAPDDPGHPVRLITISASSSVQVAIDSLRAAGHDVRVSCSESRPGLEGRRLAEALASAGLPVRLFTDAAIAHALDDADVVLVGADAIGPDGFINKSGTRMLAAAAAMRGLPFHVVASRDKLTSPALWPRIAMTDAAPDEVWDTPPSGVTVRNPYFERTPLDLVTTVVSDLGVLGTGAVAQACEAMQDAAFERALVELTEL